MSGFSIETCIGMILALFLILFASPAGIKKTSEQLISAQIYYGGLYLASTLGLFNVIVYTWLYPNGVLVSGWFPEFFISIWSALISSLFGAVYWILLCLYFIRKIRNLAGTCALFLWPAFMLFQNYLPKIYSIGVKQTELLALREPTTDLLTSWVIALFVVVISYVYWTLGRAVKGSSQERFD